MLLLLEQVLGTRCTRDPIFGHHPPQCLYPLCRGGVCAYSASRRAVEQSFASKELATESVNNLHPSPRLTEAAAFLRTPGLKLRGRGAAARRPPPGSYSGIIDRRLRSSSRALRACGVPSCSRRSSHKGAMATLAAQTSVGNSGGQAASQC